MSLPAGITPKTLTIGVPTKFNGSPASGSATLTGPVNLVHTPTGTPLFSGKLVKQFSGLTQVTFTDLTPTDAAGLNRTDWTYTLEVRINGAVEQPEPVNFPFPEAGPDTLDYDTLVTVPSSAGTPVVALVLTAEDLPPLLAAEVADSTSDTAVALRAAVDAGDHDWTGDHDFTDATVTGLPLADADIRTLVSGDIGAEGTAITAALDANYLPAAARVDFATAAIESRKSVDESVTNSASMQDDDELAVPLEEDGVYRITGLLYLDGPTAADFKCQWRLPSGATMKWRTLSINVTATTQPGTTYYEALTETGVGKSATLGAGVQIPMQIIGTITTTNPGAARLQWAQNLADATATKVCAGSWIQSELIKSRTIALSRDVATYGGELFTVESPQKSYSLALTPAPASPTYARCELREGDQWAGDIGTHTTGSGRQRVELAGTTKWPFSTDVWGSMAIRVAAGTLPSTYTILSQFLQRPPTGEAGGRSPVLQFRLEAGDLRIFTTGDPTATTTVNPANSTRYAAAFTEAGTWMNIVFRAQFHWSTGQLQVWKNGTQLINLSNITLGFNDTRGPYFKFGMYRQGAAVTNVVEYANVEIGTADLTARISSPLTNPA